MNYNISKRCEPRTDNSPTFGKKNKAKYGNEKIQKKGILISSRKIFLFRCFVLNAEINERNVTEIHRGQVTLRFTVSSNAGDSLGSLTACSINN